MSLLLGAFSRDPACLFADHQAPAVGRGTAQPVAYHNVRLRAAMGRYPAQSRVHTVLVDWVRGDVSLFDSSYDAINRVPGHRGALPTVEAQEHGDVYVRETYAFFLRGHSLYHAQCVCEPQCCTSARAATLGFLSPNPPEKLFINHMAPCPVGFRGEPRTVRDIEVELGVASLLGKVQVNLGRDARPVRMPLLEVLTQLAGFALYRKEHRMSQGATLLRLPGVCVPDVIACGEDAENAARVLAPRPYVFMPREHDVLTRHAIERELRTLVERRRVRMVEADVADGWAVFWNGDAAHLEPADWRHPSHALLRDRWAHAAPPRQLQLLTWTPSAQAQPHQTAAANNNKSHNNNKASNATPPHGAANKKTQRPGKRKRRLPLLSGQRVF